MPKDVSDNFIVSRHRRLGATSDGRNAKGRLSCLICKDGVWRNIKHCPKHEDSAKHKALVEFYEKYSNEHDAADTRSLVETSTGFITSSGFIPAARPSSSQTVTAGLLGRAFTQSQTVVADMNEVDAEDGPGVQTTAEFDGYMDTIDVGDDFGLSSIDSDYKMEDSVDAMIIAQTTIPIEEWLNEGPDIDSDAYSLDSEERPDFDYAPDTSLLLEIHARQSRAGDENLTWFPWPNKTHCILDILRNLPRSIFSDKQNNIIHWGMSVLGISDIPSDQSVKTMMQSLQVACGIRTIRYEGSLGHVYYANDLLSLMAQEMANPRVRPFLHFYPEDNGNTLGNAYEAQCWLKEMDAELLTPVVTMGQQKYYIYEPVVLSDQTCCIPTRWFKRNGQLFAYAWKLRRRTFLGSEHWIVLEYDCFEVSISNFAASFPYYAQSYLYRNLPDPSKIFGSLRTPDENVRPWRYTKPKRGNEWQEKSKGHPVYAFPIWLYCDDTSGNKTKKWNKHNSFLFVPAGLSHHMVHREYNLHFISTSNIAEPLEMLEGIVDQIDYGQEHGIWAWDCVAEEVVILIPSVLALLGDNPMQSEFASHIGMNSKFFCRVCLVSNPTIEDQATDENGVPVNGVQDNGDSSGTDEVSQAGDNPVVSESSTNATNRNGKKTGAGKGKRSAKPKKKQTSRGKKVETLGQLVDRTREFLSPGKPRNKIMTTQNLTAIFNSASTVRGMAEAKRLKTAFGLKDKYQEFFIDKITRFTQGFVDKMTIPQKQLKITEYVQTFPKYTMNPVWRIRSLDANQDTPVEVLHVVLLGFIKYFWRDAVARLKPSNKAKLIVRISSIDTSGLGLPPLSGKTLVQYSGSLTGRDFRVIAQIAPFVLYGMLPEECYNAWLALSALVPMIWMPVISDLEDYLGKLTIAINRFLDYTARFTPRWFNKPKFHILLHLPDHIRRFGPAILFATETFESYNVLIRDHSIHSNRQAPSRDIGQGFANANRIRHLTSGAKFQMGEIPLRKGRKGDNLKDRTVTPKENHELNAEDLWVVGSDAMKFIKNDPQLQKYIGFPDDESNHKKDGLVRKGKGGILKWLETRSSQTISIERAMQAGLYSRLFVVFTSCGLLNGDSCSVDSWIIARLHADSTSIARVVEILQITGSPSEYTKQPDFILLELYRPGALAETFRLPMLFKTGHNAIIPYKDVLCLASVLHNCADRDCGLSNTRVVRQECEDVAERALAVCHVSPEDVVLNCFKMRDFQYIQPFCPLFRATDRESMIHEGSVREIDARKARSQRLASTSTDATVASGNAATSTANSQNNAAISPFGNEHDSRSTTNSQDFTSQVHQPQHSSDARLEFPAEGSSSLNRRNLQVSKNPLERVRRTG